VFRNRPITRKLMTVILLTSSAVLTLTCGTFFVYELVTFRQSMVRSLSTLARAIAANSTAALAFENADDAAKVLSALAAEPHVVATALYDQDGALFASYVNPTAAAGEPPLPSRPGKDGYRFDRSSLSLHEPVMIENRRLGTLYLQSDLGAMYQRFSLYGAMVLAVVALASVVAFVLAIRLQRHITEPVLALARTAKTVSEKHDFTIRAERFDDDELGELTDAFNAMLTRVHERDRALRAQGDALRREVSERKAVEQEIRRLNATLEQRVSERTFELEASNKELDAFAYSISHDLRAPLRAVDGFSRILLEEYAPALPSEAQHYLEVARSSALNMGNLIDGLLAFSRLGRQPLRKQPVSPAALVQEVLNDLRPEFEGRRVDVTVGDLPPCEADTLLLKQVFVNLLTNAFKYTRQRDEAVIVVGASDRADLEHAEDPARVPHGTRARNGIVYFVRDNGAGFDMRYRDKLFGVFQRLHSADAFEGIGVGLALVERIVHRHGGRVWAHGEVDRGATFYFTLNPVSADSDGTDTAIEETSARRRESAQASPCADRRGLRA
jgi:signal transduction histidine kinase